MGFSSKAWVRLPLELLRQQGITKAAAAVCAVIIDRATDHTASDLLSWVTVSVAEIAAETGYDRRTVCRAIKNLELVGLISVEHAARSGSPNRYRMTASCIELCGAAVQPKRRWKPDRSQSKRSSAQPSAAKIAKMAEYLELVNQFDDT